MIGWLARIGGVGLMLSLATLALAEGAGWKPVPGHVATRWAKGVDPARCHPEYPRPQMRRREWQSLNGLWDFAVTPMDAPKPESWDGKILVPFPIESSLSGVGRRVDERSALIYHRTLQIPAAWAGQSVLLQFGAIDWHATVSLNGSVAAEHRGGYDAFTVDLGNLKPDRAYDLTVRVEDATGDGQARGKQWREPKEIWFTSATGIWQSVWMEPVPAESIADLNLVPDIDAGKLQIRAGVSSAGQGLEIEAAARDGDAVIACSSGPASGEIALQIPNAKLWSPDHPFLYRLHLRLTRRGKTIDEVESYFGMRSIALGKDASGVTRPMLNGKFVFQVGQLDQGYWPDGIYTAPTDEALRWDIEETKRFGFNMIRKHVKVEPDRWYYWCDKLGMLVWQDMPSAHELCDWRVNEKHSVGPEQFEHELARMVEGRRCHPSIIMWVVFNEGWGQHDTERLVGAVRQLDPNRLIDAASGWLDHHVGDVVDMHKYPGPDTFAPEPHRAAVLGEFGGIGHGVPGHSWSSNLWGDPKRTPEQLAGDYEGLMRRVYELRDRAGLSACVYCEMIDVEIEQAGLVTCDREVEKMPAERIAAANRGQFATPR